jgi:hypothetical protein
VFAVRWRLTSTCNGATFYYDEAEKNAVGRLSKIRYSGVACTLGQYNPPGYDFIEEYWYTAGGLPTKKSWVLRILHIPRRSKKHWPSVRHQEITKGKATSIGNYFVAGQVGQFEA